MLRSHLQAEPARRANTWQLLTKRSTRSASSAGRSPPTRRGRRATCSAIAACPCATSQRARRSRVPPARGRAWQVTLLIRELSTLLSVGVPLLEALDTTRGTAFGTISRVDPAAARSRGRRFESRGRHARAAACLRRPGLHHRRSRRRRRHARYVAGSPGRVPRALAAVPRAHRHHADLSRHRAAGRHLLRRSF